MSFLKDTNRFDTLQIALCQNDLTLLMSILLENIGEAVAHPTIAQPTLPEARMIKKGKGQISDDHHEGITV